MEGITNWQYFYIPESPIIIQTYDQFDTYHWGKVSLWELGGGLNMLFYALTLHVLMDSERGCDADILIYQLIK